MILLIVCLLAYIFFQKGYFFKFVDWIHPKIEDLVYHIVYHNRK